MSDNTRWVPVDGPNGDGDRYCQECSAELQDGLVCQDCGHEQEGEWIEADTAGNNE